MDVILRDRRAILVFLAPALLVYTAVLLAPIVWSLVYTFYEGNVLSGFKYVGLKNFHTLIHDHAFWTALRFTLEYGALVTVFQVALGLLLALMFVFYLRRGSALVRTLVFFPVVLPTVAVAQLFAKVFAIAPQYGLVNSGLHAVHLNGWIQDWLGRGNTALLVLVLMDVWRSMGFYAVLLYAGLVDVPEEILESARLDGASGLRLVRHVVLPLLGPVLFSALIFSINGTLKVFDSVVALTNGGPGQATTPLTLYMFNNAFSYGEYGYASAVATALSILCLLITLAVFGFARRDVTR
ncbi:MAG TPA: sugar ABC transporter permease [Gaiellaceae bacterium]|nr:sugar ABC transporter permease [Gaiellaceae bacterium]